MAHTRRPPRGAARTEGQRRGHGGATLGRLYSPPGSGTPRPGGPRTSAWDRFSCSAIAGMARRLLLASARRETPSTARRTAQGCAQGVGAGGIGGHALRMGQNGAPRGHLATPGRVLGLRHARERRAGLDRQDVARRRNSGPAATGRRQRQLSEGRTGLSRARGMARKRSGRMGCSHSGHEGPPLHPGHQDGGLHGHHDLGFPYALRPDRLAV